MEIIDNLQKFIDNFWKLSKKFQKNIDPKIIDKFPKVIDKFPKIIDNFKFIDNFKKLSIIPSHMARAINGAQMISKYFVILGSNDFLILNYPFSLNV